MKYFKTVTGQVLAYESDGSQDDLIQPGLIPLTEEQVTLILNPAPTFEQLKAEFIQAVQQELDQDAQNRGYDNITSACSKASIPGIFQAECLAFGERWRDSWAHCYAELDKVESGLRPIPTKEEILSELPPRVSG